jgi:hypothetical protein
MKCTTFLHGFSWRFRIQSKATRSRYLTKRYQSSLLTGCSRLYSCSCSCSYSILTLMLMLTCTFAFCVCEIDIYRPYPSAERAISYIICRYISNKQFLFHLLSNVQCRRENARPEPSHLDRPQSQASKPSNFRPSMEYLSLYFPP